MPKSLKITADQIRRATRDPLMVRVIQGVTKAAVHVDRRKEANRKACRRTEWHHGARRSKESL